MPSLFPKQSFSILGGGLKVVKVIEKPLSRGPKAFCGLLIQVAG